MNGAKTKSKRISIFFNCTKNQPHNPNTSDTASAHLGLVLKDKVSEARETMLVASRVVADTLKVRPGGRPVMAQVDSFAVVGVGGQVCVPPSLLMVRVYCTLVVKLSWLITTVAVVAPVPMALTMTGALQNQCFIIVLRVWGTAFGVMEQWMNSAYCT